MNVCGGLMSLIKFTLAVALFVTSVTFQETILVTQNGTVASWDVTITSNQVLANQAAQEMEMALY